MGTFPVKIHFNIRITRFRETNPLRSFMQFLLEPEVQQGIRRHSSLAGQDLNLSGHFFIHGIIYGVGFDIDLKRGITGLIPEIAQIVPVWAVLGCLVAGRDLESLPG